MPTRGTKYKNPEYLRARYASRRSAGLCLDCPAKSPTHARCDECRRCINLKRRKAA